MGDRIIDGIKTKGSTTIAQTESWVEAYKIKYSSDGVSWNPVIDDTKAEQVSVVSSSKSYVITTNGS